MKVLHVIPSVAPVRGGPSQAIIEMVKALENKGLEVAIATTNDNGPELLDVPTDDWTMYQGVAVRFFSRFSPNVGSVREFAFSSQLTQWLWRHVTDYDLIHVHAIFSYPSTAAMTIARTRGVPYVVRPLGQLCEWSLTQSAQKKQLYLKLIERANLNGSSGLHLTSSQESQEVSALSLDTTPFVVPHGLQLPDQLPDARQRLRSHFDLPVDEPVVLFLSRLHPKKGIDYLVASLGALRDQRFRLIIAGNGDPEYEETIRGWVNEHGLSERTIMPGFVGGELKQLLLQGADVFALTSYSENFGVAVLEALAAGTAALVTPGVALSALVAEHGFSQVAKLDTADITEQLRVLLNNPQGLEAMGRAARSFVMANYTWEQVAKVLMEVYATSVKKTKAIA